MRTALFVTLALALVTLAGCSDDPPSGDFSSTGSALKVDANLAKADFVVFNDPTSNAVTDAAGQSCVLDPLPPQGDAVYGAQKCTPASSDVSAHIMTLPYEGNWLMALMDTQGVNPAKAGTALEAAAAGMYNWNYTSDVDDRDMYDAVALYLGDKLVATSGLSQGSVFEVVPALSGISYTASHSGKTLTLTVSGVDDTAGYSFTGWLVSVDDLGAKSHDAEFSIAGNGEVVFEAPMNVAKYQQFHIHVSGTSLNVATGTIA